ncbi:DUF3221 domain-containing protein [Metabacillus halosaccharovorans]|nr:DUF3221 domain-containing protein [Metabacillus halosaccharovorans]
MSWWSIRKKKKLTFSSTTIKCYPDKDQRLLYNRAKLHNRGVDILKRKYPILFIVILIGLLSACSSSVGDRTGVNSNFIGKIKEINGQKAIVYAKIFEGNPEGDVFVDLSVNNTKTFKVGDKIKIEFDGMVLESNPAQINTLSVQLIE